MVELKYGLADPGVADADRRVGELTHCGLIRSLSLLLRVERADTGIDLECFHSLYR
jgi:hypothetical protein